MSLQQSIVRQAAKEFSQGNYHLALDLYRQLASRLGEKYFSANIALCEKRLSSQGRRDCSQLPLQAIKVACVMDEFTFHSYQPECNLLALTPQGAIAELAGFEPDLLFVESAWRGKDELWNRKIGALSNELRSVLQWCRRRQVPTLFWNKEDPIHFETFLTTAQQFDHVFTTDIDCIARYKAALGHSRVYLLPFACQPKMHNPLELYARKDAFCFAGAYYVRYPERTRDLETYVAELPQFKPLEIFDRNFGKDDANYQFPPKYQPYIVGTLPFSEIDKAYKGYRYAINLNSIKQSQTMFARRVYELLGSNTITVSNFSRGVRLLFGDLVIASDSGKEIVNRLQNLSGDEGEKLRLAGLRKVMLEHTYQHRLAYAACKALGWRGSHALPSMVVAARVSSADDCRWLIDNFRRQTHTGKRLVVALAPNVQMTGLTAEELVAGRILTPQEAAQARLGDLVAADEWLAPMAVDDYYGPNYLLDVACATRYSDARVIGKAAHHALVEGNIRLLEADTAYRPTVRLVRRSCAVHADTLPRDAFLLRWLDPPEGEAWCPPGLAIDPFNYCRNGRQASDPSELGRRVDDLPLDTGVSIDELVLAAENIPPASFDESNLAKWSASRLRELHSSVKHPQISFQAEAAGLTVCSSLPDGKHEYLYAREDLPLSALPVGRTLETHLAASPGLDLQYVFVFLDARKQKISHLIYVSNRNYSAQIPPETAFVRFGWRISGSGTTTLRFLLWGHVKLEPARLLGRSDTLLLTNHYPSYDDLYRNAFVHSRVSAYRKRGVIVDVFRLRRDVPTCYHEFENVDVVTGGQPALRKLLEGGRYKRVMVHFLSEEMWEVLEHYQELELTVWVHGAEIQPWHRREYNYRDEQERAKAMRESKLRTAFWHRVLNPMPQNLKLVFVSRYFAEEVFEDLGFRLPDDRYTVIHNPIDTELFSYQTKPAEQRKRVLSVRPYASRQYANDLSVAALLKLSESRCFSDMEFRMIGDGKLFEETLQPLRKFPNVQVEKRFLTHAEIAALHKEYGVFLVPTRWDSHGVSRDEAMASGLVPVTTSVAAIPEFVDETSGIVVPPEDAVELASAMEKLYESPELFKRLSKGAAERVIAGRASRLVTDQEIRFFQRAVEARASNRPVSFLSFDVEALPGRAEEDPLGRLVWGRFDGKEFGIRRISQILKEYGIKGNFLVDFSACLLYGDKAVREVIDFLISEQHEVHVHLHSEWVIRKWGLSDKNWSDGPVGMDLVDNRLSHSLLRFAAFKYRQFVGRSPVLFRAGAYKFNSETVAAAKATGFKACSNFNSARHAAAWKSEDQAVVNNEPFQWANGLIEIPVDLSPEPLSHDWAVYKGSFERMLSRKKLQTFNLTMHSWSLLTRDANGHFVGFSAEHDERLHRMCEHLKANSRPMGYEEFLSANSDIRLANDNRCILAPGGSGEAIVHCSVCSASYGKPLSSDVCPSCESRARHRQILDVLTKIGNPFDGRDVLACHANPVEKQAILGKANTVLNFDVRPLGYADIQMDIQAMDKVEDSSFDAFVAIHVLNHVEDDAKAIQEIHRVLKPGGFALVTIPCREGASTERCENITEHYGKEALTQFGVGTYRRYGLDDATRLFAKSFVVSKYRGFDEISNTHEYVFLLSKTE